MTTFTNPILAGDRPDPAVIKVGDEYWMTYSSFEAAPGLLLYRSSDLVNWTYECAALPNPIGNTFAVDIAEHDGRFFIYIPFIPTPWSTLTEPSIFVIHAPSMSGPWSEPIDLGIRWAIDPGHVVGEDGRRYLLVSGIRRIQLSDDGLSTVGELEKVYDGWRYPDEWITEAYALEGPKLLRRDKWFYIISAVGGTGGPPTGHMVIVARSRSIDGPWQNCPNNPIVRTRGVQEAWWSRGHATAVEGPNGKWYMVYHGYENGFRTLGRQTLLDPIEWTPDGWPESTGGDLSRPLPKPTGRSGGPHGMPRSDDFSKLAFGTRWTFYGATPDEVGRAHLNGNALVMRGKGTGPSDCSPLTQSVGDRAYEISVVMELAGEVLAGLLLFFNDRLYLGMGHDGQRMTTYRGGKPSYWQEPAPATRKLWLRMVNENHIVTFYYSEDGKAWTRHGVRSEVSGYNANTIDDLASLRPALFAAGSGSARFTQFRYRAKA